VKGTQLTAELIPRGLQLDWMMLMLVSYHVLLTAYRNHRSMCVVARMQVCPHSRIDHTHTPRRFVSATNIACCLYCFFLLYRNQPPCSCSSSGGRTASPADPAAAANV
jgi:hypothetical protein